MYDELISEFAGQRVVDLQDTRSWKGPEAAYRVRVDYEDRNTIAEQIDLLLKQPGSDRLEALIIGAWTGSFEGNDSGPLVKKLVEIAFRLPALRALFVGEMTYEESEISWIKQSDLSPLLGAFPRLETLRVRGGEGLAFSRIRHDALRSLAIETGGLSRSTIRDIFLCEFPDLEHLELLLGEENYGFDGSVEDLQPVLSGRLYPKLRYLGLMNSVIANDIAAVVVNSPIVERIETLDLSLGNLDDEGVRSLMGLPSGTSLKVLNISHHYAAEDTVARLQQSVKCQVIADDPQEPEDEWRPIVHAE